MNGAVEIFKALGTGRIGAMGVVAAILIGFFAIVIMRLSTPQMTPLYTDLTFEDSAAIIRHLDSSNTPYQLRQDGAAILVSQDQVLRTRMQLAEQGLPTGGSVGYEIFDKTDTLGTTSFVQSINHLRALEGELARTIRAIDRVSAARVHLVLPERQLFQRDREEPTASIVLRVRGTLDTSQIRAIQHLTATAVEGLKPGRVSIVDETGQLLASGGDDEVQGLFASALQERTVAHERRLRDRIETIVSEVVGTGRARVQVAAELDFNRITQTSEQFDPEGQVVRSSQAREEASSVAGDRQGGVSASTQLPEASSANEEGNQREATSSSEEITNYEISKTQRTEIVEAGRIKRISVAVLVDGNYANSDTGELTYSPRSAEDLERIATLVRSAVGFDKSRGDLVDVVNLRFASAPSQINLDQQEAGLFDFTKRDLFYFAELGVIVLLSLLTLLFVVRPLVRKIVAPTQPSEQLAAAAGDSQTAIAADGSLVSLPAPGGEEASEDWISAAQAEGELHASSIERVGDLIENYPNEAVSIVRNWLNDAPVQA